MSDLVRDAKFLRYHYTSDEALLDKDIQKNASFEKYSINVGATFLVPLFFQCWQLSLINNMEKAALYRKVRIFKALTFVGAMGVGVYERAKLEKYWTFLNRFYPEPTELQKSLYRDAMMFKELNYQEKSIEERLKLDMDTVKIYEQLYRLPPATDAEPDNDPNPPTIKPHW